jgi:hypothetical protein
MPAAKVKGNTSPDDLKEAETPVVDGQEQADNKRRFADSLKPKGRKLKLDRRVADEDRRTGGPADYKVPARRENPDQRESRNDRRDED